MRQEQSKSRDVFVSHSSKDKPWADAACAVLERHGVRCWIAPRDITPGAEWGAAIIEGIDACRVMVLVFSTHANASAQVRREVERAISKELVVLPVRIEDVLPQGAMEFALGNTHWLDAFSPPMERRLEMLADSVKTLLGRDTIPGEIVDDPAPPAEPNATRGRRKVLGLLAAVAGLLIVVGAGAGLLIGRDKTVRDPSGNDRGKTSDVASTKDRQGPPKVDPAREAGPSSANSPEVRIIASRFGPHDNDGWYTRNQDNTLNATGPIKVMEASGNYYLHVDDIRNNNKEWGWHAPAKFHGDHSDTFGRTLRYSIWTDHSNPEPHHWYVVLWGSGMTLFVDGTTMLPPVAGRWKRYTIRLDATGGWRKAGNKAKATDDEIKKVLSNIAGLRIKGEYTSVVDGPDSGGLDDVVFGGL